MTTNNKLEVQPPDYLRDLLPPVERLLDCFSGEQGRQREERLLYRAAYVPAAILPERVTRAYRFGPPRQLLNPDGSLPFWWLYVADQVETAVWESGFCKNDITRPGTFYFDSFAVEHGVIAELRFLQPLKLWNLHGEAASKLGIYDQLSSPDHEWSQWLGTSIFRAMHMVDPAERPDGILYPSRKLRGRAAIAISHKSLEVLRPTVTWTEEPFARTTVFEKLGKDPLLVGPPPASA
jgi:hypothetical protein